MSGLQIRRNGREWEPAPGWMLIVCYVLVMAALLNVVAWIVGLIAIARWAA